MKLSYDSENNIAYIYLTKRKRPLKTIQIASDLNLDITYDGKPYKLELLNAKKQLNIIYTELCKKCQLVKNY